MRALCILGIYPSFAIATATTQLGTCPASEFSYPDKRPGLATTSPHRVRHSTTSTSPAHGAHSVGMARQTPGRTKDATLHNDLIGRTQPSGKDHSGPRARTSR